MSAPYRQPPPVFSPLYTALRHVHIYTHTHNVYPYIYIYIHLYVECIHIYNYIYASICRMSDSSSLTL